MALSRLAQEFAAEISTHDWSDAPWRIDRAGHSREHDSRSKLTKEQLDPGQTDCLRTNVMWVTAQVLGHADPNFDPIEFARACGLPGLAPGIIKAGLRWTDHGYDHPGSAWDTNEG